MKFHILILSIALVQPLNLWCQESRPLAIIPKSELVNLGQLEKVKDEIEKNWQDVIANSINHYINHSTNDSLKITKFKKYDIAIRDTFYGRSNLRFENLIALRDNRHIEDINIFRSGIIEFILKTEYRFDKNKAILHVVRFNKEKNYRYAEKLITLDSKLFENELGILYIDHLDDAWTYEIWAYGSY